MSEHQEFPSVSCASFELLENPLSSLNTVWSYIRLQHDSAKVLLTQLPLREASRAPGSCRCASFCLKLFR
jgi:hypothetical protein